MRDGRWTRVVILAAGLLIALRLFFPVEACVPVSLRSNYNCEGARGTRGIQRALVGVTLLHALGIAVLAGAVVLVLRNPQGGGR